MLNGKLQTRLVQTAAVLLTIGLIPTVVRAIDDRPTPNTWSEWHAIGSGFLTNLHESYRFNPSGYKWVDSATVQFQGPAYGTTKVLIRYTYEESDGTVHKPFRKKHYTIRYDRNGHDETFLAVPLLKSIDPDDGSDDGDDE